MKKSIKAIVGLSLLASVVLNADSLVAKGELLPKVELPKKIDIPRELSKQEDRYLSESETIKPPIIDEMCVVHLDNNIVETCVSKDGTFGNGHYAPGMIYSGKDFLLPGSPYEFFSLSFVDGNGNLQVYHNNNYNGGTVTGDDNIPTQVIPLLRYPNNNGGAMAFSYIDNNHMEKLSIVQKYTLDPNAQEIIIRVEILNLGRTPIEDVRYARGLDPDQDRPTTFRTYNIKGGTFGGLNISQKNLVQAMNRRGLTVGLYSVDKENHDTCINSNWSMKPTDIVPCTTNYPSYADYTINMGFSLGTIKPQEKKVFSFKYLFENKRYYPLPVDEEEIKDILSIK